MKYSKNQSVAGESGSSTLESKKSGEYATTITMTDDNGTEQEFIVIASVRHINFNYILVAEKNLEENDEGEAVILKEVVSEGDEHIFEVIEDDGEFERAIALFQNSNDDYDLEL